MARIIVVGAGIVGLGVARAALRRGHAVTIIDRGAIPNPQGASFDQHRMIRPQYGAAIGYTRMVGDAFASWEAVWRDLGARHFADSGAVVVSTESGDYGAHTERVFRELGVAHEIWSGAMLESRLPHLRLPSHARAIVARPAGPLFADRIVEGLVGWCAAQGATLLAQKTAVGADDDSVHCADGDVLRGDLVVIAAGAWLPALLPTHGARPTWRQALCYVEAPARHRASWEASPALVTVGDWSGYTLPPLAGTRLKFGFGGNRRRGRPADGFAWDSADSSRVLDAFRPILHDADEYRPLSVQVGYYVMDETRRFVLERSGRRVVVTNCDGQMFKFGPLIGERILAAFAGELSFEALARWAAGQI